MKILYTNFHPGNGGGHTTYLTYLFRNTGAGLLKGAGTGMNIAGQLGVNPLYGAIGGGLLGGFA